MPDHIVNHLGKQDRLAHARPAEQSRLAAASRGTSTSMTLMPVSNTSDFVERLASDGGSRWMDRQTTSAGRLAVDGVAEHIEHSGDNCLADRHLEWPAGIFHGHAASEALRGIEAIPRT